MKINGRHIDVPEVWRGEPLLGFLRDHVGLMGTKLGCGRGFCGACTVHLDGEAVRACLVRVSAVGDGSVTTIEGLAAAGGLHPVQQAWKEGSVPQCGYCQPGQMMAASALINSNRDLTDEDIDRGLTNLCRCATYDRIRRGIHRAIELLPPAPEPEAPEPEAPEPEASDPDAADPEGTQPPVDDGGPE